MTSLPLLVSAQTTLDGNGNGTASTGPTGQGEVWTISVVSVRCSSNTDEAVCNVFIGPAGSTTYLLGGTTWGSTGDSDPLSQPVTLHPGQAISAVWGAPAASGDPGATAYLSVIGTKDI